MRVDKTELLTLLKDRYEYEQFRRNNFDNIIGLPITILALLVGALAAVVFAENKLSSLITTGVALGLIPIIMSTAFLARVFYGTKRKYNVLPESDVINGQFEDLVVYHANLDSNSENDIQAEVALSFQEDIIKWYIESNRINCRLNDLRAEYFHKSKLWLIISLIPIFIILVVQILKQLTIL